MAGEPARRKMDGKRLLGAVVIPVIKPMTSHCGHSEEHCHGDQWEGVVVEIMLDMGSAVSLLQDSEALSISTCQASAKDVVCYIYRGAAAYYQLS